MTHKRRILSLGFPFEVLNKDLKLLFACNLAGAFGDGLYSYLLPVYLSQTLGADSVQIGILYAITSLLSASSLLIAGMLADKYDRKKIMIAGWIAWIPAPLIFSIAGNWVQAIPGMILWGVWLGGPTVTAYVVGTADKNKMTLTFTMISASWSLGYVFSPAIGGYLSDSLGMRTVFFLAAIFYASACLCLLFVRSQRAARTDKDVAAKETSFFGLLKQRKLLKFSIFFALIMFTLMMFRPFVPQFLAKEYHYGGFEIGVLGSFTFFSSAVLGILLGRIGDRWKKSYALTASMALCSLYLILLLSFREFYALLFVFFVAGGSYTAWSLMSAIIGPLAPEQIRARWISIPQTVGMFSSVVAPYVGGVLFAASPSYPFLVAIPMTLLIALLVSSRFTGE